MQTTEEVTADGAGMGLRNRPVESLDLDAGAPRDRTWQRVYVRRLVVTDVLCGLIAATVGHMVRFGSLSEPTEARPGSLWIAALLPLVWVAAMGMSRAYEQRFLWLGPEEFRRVASAAITLLAAVGTVSWAFKLEVARGLVVVALPLVAVLTLLLRYLQRAWLHHRREAGHYQQTMIFVGHRNGVEALHRQINRDSYHGYRVVGCCLPADADADGVPETFDGLPVLGAIDDVLDVVRLHRVGAVAVLPSPELEGPALRRLGWQLEETSAELLLAPALTEIAGPRVAIRPVCGLPLLHMERVELRGLRRFIKAAVDRTVAVLAVLAILPILLGTALAVRMTSPGPVLFRQTRVGRDGEPFTMLKFRTMVVEAEQLQPTLTATDDGNGVLFKLRNDPRVTRVGRTLRRYSIDELPQLFNVFRGDMSLVGPRPPLPAEVESYGLDMHRRFIVKPGLTGLWQVSGRSDLSWEDSTRVDLHYVENWSLAFDLMIMWKTLGAVLRGSGAY